MNVDKPQDEPPGTSHQPSRPSPAHRVHIPGFNSETEVGLGDVVKRATARVGIRPCGPCRERAASLNNWMVFHGRQ